MPTTRGPLVPRLAALVLALIVATATAASADQLVVDGDGVAPVNNNNNSIQLGAVCQGTVLTRIIALGIRKGSSAPQYPSGASVLITVDSTTNGLSATNGAAAVALPSDWSTRPNNSMSDTLTAGGDRPEGRTTSKVTFTTGGLPQGNYNGNVIYRSTSGSLTTTNNLIWHANISACDTTPPALSLPGDTTAEATGATGSVVTYTVTAADTQDPSPNVSCTPVSGSTFPIGVTTVTCVARDSAGNRTTGTFTVTVRDTTGPVVTVPASISTEATGPSGAVVTYPDATATDAVDGARPATCAPASGSTFPVGTSTVTCSSTDATGNVGTQTFQIVVVDSTAPVLSLPGGLTDEATGPGGAAVTFDASASDLVDGDLAPSCTPASGATFALGTTTVTCSVTDAAGNTSSGTFTVTVRDTTPPAVTVPEDITLEATGPGGATADFSPSAADLVDGALSPTCTPAAGSTFALGTTTVTCTSTDAAGNTGSATFTVTVVDTTPPTITFVSKSPSTEWSNEAVTVTWSCADGGSGVVSATVSETVTTEGADQDVTGTCADLAGNQAQDTQTVNIDLTDPILTLPSSGGTYVLNASQLSGAACDDTLSGIASCSVPATIDTSSVGAKSLSGSAADKAGNWSWGSSSYAVRYGSGSCNGANGRTILQPINADGSSTFKRGSTVPAKFRVCDANGVSIGTPGVVSDFRLIARSTAPSTSVNETVFSTTPDTAFRWSGDGQQWIFNIATSNLTSGVKYTYRISLNDGTSIDFAFSIK